MNSTSSFSLPQLTPLTKDILHNFRYNVAIRQQAIGFRETIYKSLITGNFMYKTYNTKHIFNISPRWYIFENIGARLIENNDDARYTLKYQDNIDSHYTHTLMDILQDISKQLQLLFPDSRIIVVENKAIEVDWS